MKVEIKTNKEGKAESFKINGEECGKNTISYTIEHYGGSKPTLTVVKRYIVDELIIDNENAIGEIKYLGDNK